MNHRFSYVMLYLAFISVVLSQPTYPVQVHLAIAPDPSKMVVSWSTFTSTSSIVKYGTSSANLDVTAIGTSHQYSSTWDSYTSPYLHEVLITDIKPSTVYYYKVGDGETWSQQYTFKTRPSNSSNEGIYIAAWGDHGTEPSSISLLEKIMSIGQPNLALIAGDLAYANGESPVWDKYMNILESVGAFVPIMTSPGNHEAKGGENFIPYRERMAMPSDTYWYSIDYSTVHLISLSSEHDYSIGSPQYKWFENDLINASKNRSKQPWIIVMAHKPPYNSNSNYGSFYDFRQVLEPLMMQYSVDLGIFGHEHSYERTFPLRNGKPVTDSLGRMENPYKMLENSPIWSVVGTGGKDLRNHYQQPKPDWSAHRESVSAGFAKIYIHGDQYLHWNYVKTDGSISDEFYICKSTSCDFNNEPDVLHASAVSMFFISKLLALFCCIFLYVSCE